MFCLFFNCHIPNSCLSGWLIYGRVHFSVKLLQLSSVGLRGLNIMQLGRDTSTKEEKLVWMCVLYLGPRPVLFFVSIYTSSQSYLQ